MAESRHSSRRIQVKNRIHAVLADCGIQRTERLWSRIGRQYLTSLPLPGRAREIVNDCLSLLEAVGSPLARLDAEILAQAKLDHRAHALQTLPGIGRFTALTLLAEIGDISRFPTARKLCAWAGLTPTVRNSDRKVRHSGISKQGSTWVRYALVEAAQKARLRAPFSQIYTNIARRRGSHIATVAVARKLLARCFHILKDLER